MITKERALEILHEQIRSPNLRKHHYAVAAAMRGLAEALGGDPGVWEIIGLLHDADYEQTREQPEEHTLVMGEILAEEDVPPDLIRTIQAHNWEYSGVRPETPRDWALVSCDDLTGLIVAVALVYPDGLEGVSVESVQKKFPSSSFAAGADREKIRFCEEYLEIPLEEFIGLVLRAMKEDAEALGL